MQNHSESGAKLLWTAAVNLKLAQVLGHGVLTSDSGFTLSKSMCIGRDIPTGGDTSTQQVTLPEGSPLLSIHDDLAPEPVLPPQDAHLLNRHSLGLRQEEQHIAGHDKHPEGKEDVGAPFHPAQGAGSIISASFLTCQAWTQQKHGLHIHAPHANMVHDAEAGPWSISRVKLAKAQQH